jgi:Mg-chelatase subunit ChlI
MSDPIEHATGWPKAGERFYQQPAEQRAEALERELKSAAEVTGFMERHYAESAALTAKRLTHGLLRAAVESHLGEHELIADEALRFAVRTLRHWPLDSLLANVRQAYADANGPDDSETLF